MFKQNKSYVSIYRGQDNFMFSPDGITLVPRAHVMILEQCPWEVRDQINYALAKGWLQPVANMRDSEYTMELLKK
jgi:hypothetical protein